MGVWIEIPGVPSVDVPIVVAPLVGVWIEILHDNGRFKNRFVAPLVGVWIEISPHKEQKRNLLGRSPRGSVD